jgi:hypothetical protein
MKGVTSTIHGDAAEQRRVQGPTMQWNAGAELSPFLPLAKCVPEQTDV